MESTAHIHSLVPTQKAGRHSSTVTHKRKNMTTRTAIVKRTISYQVFGYVILLFLIIGDEVLDIPHYIFGAPSTPINWAEAIIEGMYVLLLGTFTIYLSLRFLNKIRFLEGFLPICSFCKKIRKGNDWASLEKYMSDHSEARFSHGLCPECAEKHYGEYLHHDADKQKMESTKDKT